MMMNRLYWNHQVKPQLKHYSSRRRVESSIAQTFRTQISPQRKEKKKDRAQGGDGDADAGAAAGALLEENLRARAPLGEEFGERINR